MPPRPCAMQTRKPRFQSSDGDSVIIGTNEKPKGAGRRILRVFANAILWLLTLSPGVLIIAYGANGILHKRLAHAGRFKGLTKGVSYGDDAVGWGWIFVGVGFWALGQFCALKTGRNGFKVTGWVMALGTGGIGVWVLLRRIF